MPAFESLLVDLDATAADHPAVREAFELAARCKARLTLIDVLPEIPASARAVLTPAMEQELVDHRLGLLNAVAAGRPDLPTKTAVLRGNPAIAIIREVLREKHDLVLRSHGRGEPRRRPYGSMDMQLMRKCPCPVWLIGAEGIAHPPHILAAVDCQAEAVGALDFNRKILDLALTLGHAEAARVTVLQAWSVYGEELLRPRVTAQELHEIVEEAGRGASAALAALVAEFGDRAAAVRVECLKGEPREVIPRFATEEGVDVVVMGTVARTGIAGLLMGNTAEAVLRELRGSVLAVKPAGFVTPVTLPDDETDRGAAV